MRKRNIGLAMIAAPYAAMFVYAAWVCGIGPVLLFLACLVAFGVWIWSAIELLSSDL